MKRVLIISPHFPPVNAPDMHRVRQSLPHFREFGWDPVVLAVDPERVEGPKDPALLATVPDDVEVEHVEALDARWTRKVGLGSVALRSLPAYLRAGNARLARGDVDLVYFSTTAFPVLALGPVWKRRFGIPYVVDMQDPWYSDYYVGRPKSEQPPKFWFSYRLDKRLEPVALRGVDGVISVTQAYNDTLTERYPTIAPEATTVIPFGVSARDYEAAAALPGSDAGLPARAAGEIRGVYTGVVNRPMLPVLDAVFGALRQGLDADPERFAPVRLHFVGTSYDPSGEAQPSVLPVAERYGLADRVVERVQRVPYLTALRLQQEADFLLLIGTTDPDYVASKLYPYVFARRPILAPFHAESRLVPALAATGAGQAVPFNPTPNTAYVGRLRAAWGTLLQDLPKTPDTDWAAAEPFTAREMTRRQAEFFDLILARGGAAGGV